MQPLGRSRRARRGGRDLSQWRGMRPAWSQHIARHYRSSRGACIGPSEEWDLRRSERAKVSSRLQKSNNGASRNMNRGQ
eukprot:760685-Rhodomonas_salina.1